MTQSAPRANKPAFRKLDGVEVYYSTSRVASPAGKLLYPNLDVADWSWYQRQKLQTTDEKLKRYRATLAWENQSEIKMLQDQPITKKFKEACLAFAKACGIDADDSLVLPLRKETKRLDTGGEITFYTLRAEAKPNKKPALWHMARNEAITATSDGILDHGCIAAIQGQLQLSQWQGKWYMKLLPEQVLYLRPGDDHNAGVKPPSADDFGPNAVQDAEEAKAPPIADYGVTAADIDQAIEEDVF